MPSWSIVAGASNGLGIAAGGTRYLNIGGFLDNASTEARSQIQARDSYTLAKMYVVIPTNITTSPTTFRSRINGANGNQLITVPAGATGIFQDAVNSDALVSGDRFCTQIVVGAGTGLYVTIVAYTLTTLINNTPILVSARPLTESFDPGIGTQYWPIAGRVSKHATEAFTQYRFRVACTLSNFRVYAATNTGDGAVTFRIRINGAYGNQIITIPAGTPGEFEDAVNTDVIAPGDLVGIEGVQASGAGTIQLCIMQFKATCASRHMINGTAQGVAVGSGTTTYVTPEGTPQLFGPEADCQAAAQVNMTKKNLFVRVRDNTLNGQTIVRSRVNGANGNLTVTINAGATGEFEDLVHSDVLVPADLDCYQIVTAGSSGGIAFTYIGAEQQVGGGGGGGNMPYNLGKKAAILMR